MRTSVTSALQPATVKMPWGLSLFLMVIFALVWPFDPSFSGSLRNLNLSENLQRIEEGSSASNWVAFTRFVRACCPVEQEAPSTASYWAAWRVADFLSSLGPRQPPSWAQDPSPTIRRVGVLVLLCLGAAAVAALLSQIQTAALAVCVCGFTLIISLAVELASGIFRPLDGAWRFAGVVHPVAQGWNCCLLAIASLALAAVCPRRRNRFILLALVAFLFIALTRSRTPLVSTIFACAVCGSLVSRKVRELIRVSAYILLLCVPPLWVCLGGDLRRAAEERRYSRSRRGGSLEPQHIHGSNPAVGMRALITRRNARS